MDLYQKYKELREENLILTYTGLLNMEVISQLMRLAETTLLANSAPTRQRRSVVNIFIEALQNIHYHGNSDTEIGTITYRECLLLLAKNEEAYCITTGNFVRNEDVQKLKSRLEKLTPMKVEELNQLYLKTLEKGKISEKGGAGLGLIKIFIDSKKQTLFNFQNIDENYSFFTMKMNVSN